MLNIGQLTNFLKMVPPDIGRKIKAAITTYVNGDEERERARTKLREVIPDLEKFEGYDQVVKYLKMNTVPRDES